MRVLDVVSTLIMNQKEVARLLAFENSDLNKYYLLPVSS
jgi:hypothetical protein